MKSILNFLFGIVTRYADWAIDGGRNANHVGKAEQFNPARAAVRRRMADPKTTACAPFRSAARCSSFSAAWRAARLQETVQVELVAASSTVSAAGGGRRAQFPNVECLFTARRITDRRCGGLCNFPMWV